MSRNFIEPPGMASSYRFHRHSTNLRGLRSVRGFLPLLDTMDDLNWILTLGVRSPATLALPAYYMPYFGVCVRSIFLIFNVSFARTVSSIYALLQFHTKFLLQSDGRYHHHTGMAIPTLSGRLSTRWELSISTCRHICVVAKPFFKSKGIL